jgi:tetratricopeptide (TPR) repeat protein
VKEILMGYMKLKKQVSMFLLIMIIGSSFNTLFSQNVQIKPTRQSSLEAYSKGDYEEAYKEFSELLLTYTKDPLYKYYSGICLVKMGRDPEKAESLLQQALQSADVLESLPSDALFWLGRSQQMSGNFQEAVVSFNSYTEQTGKKAARELGVSDFIQQCNENKGKVATPESKPAEVAKNEKVEPTQKVTEPIVIKTVEKPANAIIPDRINLPAAYDKILADALNYQYKADSVNAIIRLQKGQLEKLPANEKPALRSKISSNELMAASYQKSADQKYSEAEAATNPQKDIIPSEEIIKPAEQKVIKDPAQQPDNKIVKKPDTQLDTVRKITPVIEKPVESFFFFEILPKPVTDPKEKIAIDPEVPAGLIYRIQMAVFRNPVSPAYFKGITPVYGFRISGTDKTNYYAGMFRKSADASKALAKVKAKGFKDAFTVALSGNKPVSADRAALLEKEWGKKPFVTMVKSAPDTPLDTIPPTLQFRVEVIRSIKPVKDDILEGIRKMAGTRGLDIQTLDDGNIAYLVGKFITFASATEYADLMIRNGYREAHVVAWLGMKEIPVETAKQLFEDLK